MLWSLAVIPVAAGAALWAAGPRSRLGLGALACVTLGLTVVLAILAAGAGWTASLSWSRALVLTAELTPISATIAVLVPAVALPILAYAAAHEDEAGLPRLLALLLVFVGGMELVVVAADLLTLLIGWELVGACSWALIAHRWRDARNPEAGRYAFITTRLGDLGLVAAAMAAFAGTGSFSYDGLAGLEAPYLDIVAFGLLLSAAAKSGQIPFAPWLFRAMAGPTSVSALLHSATMVAAGAYLLARLESVLSRADGFAEATIAVGLATAVGGGLVAVLQNHAKKLLAASTSAHYGLMFVAVGAGYPAVAVLHLVAHAVFKALLFLAAGVAGERAGSFALDRMGYGRALPITASLAAVGALALAGVPPLGGGWTKEAIVAAAGHRDLWIAAGVIVAGGLSAAYAARFQLLAYGRRRPSPADHAATNGSQMGMGLLAGATLALSILWLPQTHDDLARLLGEAIPVSKTAELVGSIAVIGIGLLAGAILARRRPALGSEGWSAIAADWLGLPSLIHAGVTRPFAQVAAASARFDDQVIDALPRPGRLMRHCARAGERIADGLVEGVARLVAAGARETRVGERIADALPEGTAGLTVAGAREARAGERLADGLAEGTARLVGVGGRDARLLQTGLSHHYYALLAIGAASMVAILLIAGS